MTDRKEHGEEGHLNVYVRDQDSIVTHYGRHYRVVAFSPVGDELYVRVDRKHGPRMPTVSEVLDVARKDECVVGRWTLYDQRAWADGSSVDFFFRKHRGGQRAHEAIMAGIWATSEGNQ